MKKSILILAISASFIAGTLVTGNFVFADPADGQNNLLEQILQALEVQPNPKFVTASLVPQTVTCPDSSEPNESYAAVFLGFFTGQTHGIAGGILLDAAFNAGSLRTTMEVGEVTESNYILKGAVVSQNLCSGISIPSAATFSGECGIGKIATLETEEGFVAVFDANVVCG